MWYQVCFVYVETVPKKMAQMFLIIAQFPLVFCQNWRKYTKLIRFQALKWDTVHFCTYHESKVMGKNVQKFFFQFYTFVKNEFCEDVELKSTNFLH